uniref:Uncharacterized protein isoform X2 n=1 Tax=Pogona vitticeps TaxID=103695 RepID=A0ABM5GIP4_9SAUR
MFKFVSRCGRIHLLKTAQKGQSPEGPEMEQELEATAVGADGRRRKGELSGTPDPGEGPSYAQVSREEISYSGGGAMDAPGDGGRVADPPFPGTGTGSQGSARGASVRGMADWRDEATRAIGMALAPRTYKKYKATWFEFSEFRKGRQLGQAWPAPVEHMQQFIVDLHWRGLTPGTIKGKLAAMSFYARANGIRDTSNDFRIKKMIEGWSRERGKRTDDRTPISPALLSRLCDGWGRICTDRYEESLFRAAALLAFFGAMRISELVALGKKDVSRKALQLDDVTVWDDQVKVRLRSSKTDQYGFGCMVILGQCSLVSICPVRAIREFGILRGTEKGYFFQHKDGKPLTKYQFWSLTDRALKNIGIGNMRFGTHSFRIGAASTAALLGYDAGKIKRLGRWSSGCFRKYIRQLPNV